MAGHLPATVSRVFSSDDSDEVGLEISLGELFWQFDYRRQAPHAQRFPEHFEREEIYRHEPHDA
jgi:hypothetical protein